MKIESLIVGALETNCYILANKNNTIIIDPGDDFNIIKNKIKNKLVGVLLTHKHFDHIGALKEIIDYYNVPVYSYDNFKEDLFLENFKIKMIKNPGHSYDSVSYLIDNNLFCGDFIFEGTIGRTDFPTGSMIEMQESIRNILKYPDNIIIYPGHGNNTTLKNERPTLESFLY